MPGQTDSFKSSIEQHLSSLFLASSSPSTAMQQMISWTWFFQSCSSLRTSVRLSRKKRILELRFGAINQTVIESAFLHTLYSIYLGSQLDSPTYIPTVCFFGLSQFRCIYILKYKSYRSRVFRCVRNFTQACSFISGYGE